MTSLTPESRALIEAARPGEELPDGERDRMKGELLARIAAGAVVAGTVAGSAAKAAAATKAAGQAAGTAGGAGVLSMVGGGGSLGALAKGGIGLVLLCGVGLGAHELLSEPSAAPVPVAAATAGGPVAANEEMPAATKPVRGAEAAADETAADETPASAAPRPSPERGDQAAAGPGAGAASGPAPAASSLAAETSLLQQAQSELQAGNADRALELLERHGSEHSGGALREERQAARVLALCSAGRVAAARAEAQRFASEFPRSPQRARVLAACAEE